MRRLKEDIELLGSITSLLLFLITAVTWMTQWPGQIVSTVLFVIGCFALATAWGGALAYERRAATRPLTERAALFLGALLLAGLTGAIASYPTVVRVVGGVALAVLLVASGALLFRILSLRYRPRR